MLTPYSTVCDVLVKVGGSILDNAPHTTALAESLATLPSNLRVVILTGGGRIAKRIKANQLEHPCDFHTCWKATTLALDVNAGLLASHSSRFCVVTSIEQIITAQQSGRIPVFAPATALFGSLWFTPNWVITTDTMGLHFAHDMGAARYVIVTDVDGVCERAPGPGYTVAPISKLSVAQLEKLPSSKLDAAFPGFFRRFPLHTLVVNGKHPPRVLGAICGRRTIGTEIALDPELSQLESHDVGTRRSMQCQDAAGTPAAI